MEFYNKFCGQIPGLAKRVVLSSRRRSNNYLELPRENISGNMMLHIDHALHEFFFIFEQITHLHIELTKKLRK